MASVFLRNNPDSRFQPFFQGHWLIIRSLIGYQPNNSKEFSNLDVQETTLLCKKESNAHQEFIKFVKIHEKTWKIIYKITIRIHHVIPDMKWQFHFDSSDVKETTLEFLTPDTTFEVSVRLLFFNDKILLGPRMRES